MAAAEKTKGPKLEKAENKPQSDPAKIYLYALKWFSFSSNNLMLEMLVFWRIKEINMLI